MPPRRCIYGCPIGKVSLFACPKAEGSCREKWLALVSEPTPHLFVCARHFTDDCFVNKAQYDAGFASRMQLKEGSVPTIKGRIVEPETRATTSDVSSHYRHSVYQTDPGPAAAAPVTAQPDHRAKTVCSQCFCYKREVRMKNKGVQTSVSCSSTGTQITQKDSWFLFSSDPVKADASLLGVRPAKRRRSEVSEDAEESISEVQLPHATCEVGSEIESISDCNGPKYIVFESCLRKLFQTCPRCEQDCEVQQHNLGTFVSFTQICLKCPYGRSWESQPTRKKTPVGNLLMSAAVYLTGGSFVQVERILKAMNIQMFQSSTFKRFAQMFREPAGNDQQTLVLVQRGGDKTTAAAAVTTAADSPDVQQAMGIKQEGPQSPGLDQQDQQDPESVHIKQEEEEEEVWKGPPTDITVVKVKSEDDEEKPPSSLLHHPEDSRDTEPPTGSSTEPMKTEGDGDCGGAGARNQDPEGKTSGSSETEVSDDEEEEEEDDWKEPLTDSKNEDNGLKTSEPPPGHLVDKSDADPLLKIHAGEKPYICEFCGKMFGKKQNLQTHLRVHTGEKPFHCDVCGKKFRHYFSLKSHVRIHTGEKPFVCSVCGESFTQQQNLKRHTRVHTGEKPFSCDVCGERFAQQGVLKRHMSVHTRQTAGTHECPLETDSGDTEPPTSNSTELKKTEGDGDCGGAGARNQDPEGKTSDSSETEISEEEEEDEDDEEEEDDDDWQEPLTDSGSETEDGPHGLKMLTPPSRRLVREKKSDPQVQIDSGEKPCVCGVCGKMFKQTQNLKTHLRVHTGEKPFHCDVCGKRFQWASSLQVHMNVHSGEKPFVCGVCQKSFAVQQNFKRHMRVHTREKTFSCDDCGKKFVGQRGLNKHVRVHRSKAGPSLGLWIMDS